VTTGLADWLDVYLRAGAAQLLHDYRNNEYVQQYLGQVSKGYDGGPRLGLGGGGRLWWRGHAGARVAGFLQADAYYVRSEGTIQAARDTSRVVRRDRKLDWADVGAAVGLARQGSAAAVHFGVGISEAWWRIRDTDQVQHAGFGWRVGYPTRSTWEVHEPVFVFAGVELLLPHEFRISTQGAVRTAESFAIGVAVCQGLERQE